MKSIDEIVKEYYAYRKIEMLVYSLIEKYFKNDKPPYDVNKILQGEGIEVKHLERNEINDDNMAKFFKNLNHSCEEIFKRLEDFFNYKYTEQERNNILSYNQMIFRNRLSTTIFLASEKTIVFSNIHINEKELIVHILHELGHWFLHDRNKQYTFSGNEYDLLEKQVEVLISPFEKTYQKMLSNHPHLLPPNHEKDMNEMRNGLKKILHNHSEDDIENKEADTFASCFLIPRFHYFSNNFQDSDENLAKAYQVPIDTVIKRRQEINFAEGHELEMIKHGIKDETIEYSTQEDIADFLNNL